MDDQRFGLARRTTILAYCAAQRWAGRISQRLAEQQNLHGRPSMQITFAKMAAEAQKMSLETSPSKLDEA
jgi:hypothetical protein